MSFVEFHVGFGKWTIAVHQRGQPQHLLQRLFAIQLQKVFLGPRGRAECTLVVKCLPSIRKAPGLIPAKQRGKLFLKLPCLFIRAKRLDRMQIPAEEV